MSPNRTSAYRAVFIWVALFTLGIFNVSLGNPLTCRSCGHSNPPNLIICEECGYWLEKSEHPITAEATLAVGRANTTNEVEESNYQGEVIGTYEYDEDTTSIVLNLRKYFKGRYQHPSVPIGFIPYNFRTSYVDLAIGLFETELSPIHSSFHTSFSYDEWLIRLGGKYYWSSDVPAFIESRVLYGFRTQDRYASEEWEWERFRAQLITGLHSPKYRLGIGATSLVRNSGSGSEGVFGLHNDNCWEFISFAEYMMNPRVIVHTSYERRPENDGYNSWWQIPIGFSYVNTSSWFELGKTVTYSSHWWGDQLSVMLDIRQFIGDNHIYVIPEWVHVKSDAPSQRTGDIILISIGGGLQKRRNLLILPSLTYSWGDHPIASNMHIDGLKFGLAFKALL